MSMSTSVISCPQYEQAGISKSLQSFLDSGALFSARMGDMLWVLGIDMYSKVEVMFIVIALNFEIAERTTQNPLAVLPVYDWVIGVPRPGMLFRDF